MLRDTRLRDFPDTPYESLRLVFENVHIEEIEGHFVITNADWHATLDLVGGGTIEAETALSIKSVDLSPDFTERNPFKADIPENTSFMDMDHPPLRYKFHQGKLVPDIKVEELEAIEFAITEITSGSAGDEEDPTDNSGKSAAQGEETTEIRPDPNERVYLISSIIVGVLLGVSFFFIWWYRRKR